MPSGGPLTLDLTSLVSADDAGVAALRSYAGRGVQLVGVSPYMALLLKPGRRGTRAELAATGGLG